MESLEKEGYQHAERNFCNETELDGNDGYICFYKRNQEVNLRQTGGRKYQSINPFHQPKNK